MSVPRLPAQRTHAAAGRPPLRLRISPVPGRGALDGAWWPRSRDLPVELADLVDLCPADLGRIDHVVVCGPDWETVPRRVMVARGQVKVGTYPGDDSARILLGLSSRQVLQLMVVPPGTPPATGWQLMRACADPENRKGARQLLAELTEEYGVATSADHWFDDGGSWWDPNPVPPSVRVR